MIDNYIVNRTDQMLTLMRPDGKTIPLTLGSVVSADVLDIIASGMVTLRITPPVGKGEGSQPTGDSTQGKVITAQTNVPMSEGDRVTLQVIGGDKEIRLKFLGVSQAQTTLPRMQLDTLQQRLQSLLSEFSGSRLTSADFQQLSAVLKAIPPGIKDNFPEFSQLEKLMPDMEQMNGQALKTSVEGSGVLLETRLKLAVLQEFKSSPEAFVARDALSNVIKDATRALEGIHDIESQC
ncbi:MAG: hypothetical protein HQK89_17125, partial [Nitrospirae bacterium]|nr:hypothetical protein [Nitrospirota bacterium]